MDSKTFPKGYNPGKGCFNCPYPDCINPDVAQRSEEEMEMSACGWLIPKAIERRREYHRAHYKKHHQEILEARRKRRQKRHQEILDE